jgi:ligand-binding SRPBCC domain-containing protein
VFEFFKNPRNLELLTPPWLGFRIVAANDSVVRKGTHIRYRLRLFGIPFSWESKITEYEERELFADEQITGPYARWLHYHRFRKVEGGVEMTDEVEYTLPLGPLGRLVHWLVVRHQLRSIFDYRNRVISERFGGVATAAVHE